MRVGLRVHGIRYSSSWQCHAAMMLERPAGIVKEMNPFEKAYYNMLQQIEAENSLLSDYELELIAEKKARADAAKKGSASALQVKTMEDILQEWKMELAEFEKDQLSKINKKTEELKKDDLKRCLDQPLSLVTNQKLGSQNHWLFPQASHKQGETLRQTAERAVAESMGDNVEILTLGNAPCTFYKYKYPKALQDELKVQGAKVFFFKAQYRSGLQNEGKKCQHVWATMDELKELLPKAYLKAVQPSFFHVPEIDFRPYLDVMSQKSELEKVLEVKQKAKN